MEVEGRIPSERDIEKRVMISQTRESELSLKERRTGKVDEQLWCRKARRSRPVAALVGWVRLASRRLLWLRRLTPEVLKRPRGARSRQRGWAVWLGIK
jgi:hypothetical protein